MTITATSTLSEVLAELGYTVSTNTAETGNRTKTILHDGEAIRFPEGTLPGEYAHVTNLHSTTAGIVWAWLRATNQLPERKRVSSYGVVRYGTCRAVVDKSYPPPGRGYMPADAWGRVLTASGTRARRFNSTETAWRLATKLNNVPADERQWKEAT